MNVHYLLKSIQRTLFISIVLIVSSLATIHAEQIKLAPMVQLNNVENQVQWGQVLYTNTNKPQFLLSEQSGKILLVNNDQLLEQPIIDLKKYFPQLKMLTAFTLHPSFNFAQQQGFQTFYTAHIETFNSNKRTKRIAADEVEQTYPYDIVLTEWKLIISGDLITVKPNSLREVVRIPTHSLVSKIAQLAFNPYVKSWQEEYGQLYISVIGDATHESSPLLSGSILRISPKKFGLNSYTIPKNNPFITNKEINDEIIVAGLGHINGVSWPKDTTNQLIVSIDEQTSTTLNAIKLGTNYSNAGSRPSSFYKTDGSQVSNTLLYRGTLFSQHRNDILQLIWKDNQWQLIAINIKSPYQVQQVANFSNEIMDKRATPTLFINAQNEIAVFDYSNNIIFKLQGSKKKALTNSNASSTSDTANGNSSIMPFIVFAALIALIVIFWVFKYLEGRRLANIKKLLRKQFAKFTLKNNEQKIELFKRHETDVNTSLNLADIVKSEIYLNDTLINTISNDNEQYFSIANEQKLQVHFEHEKREKMVDDKTRKVELFIHDNQNKTYCVCAYLREGNQRLTKARFIDVTDQIIDWCWAISAIIHPDKTEQRPVKAKPVIKSKSNSLNTSKPQQKTKEHSISAHSATNSPINNNSVVTDTDTNKQTDVTRTENRTNAEDHTISNNKTSDKPRITASQQNNQTDIALINSLEKLAHLKKQGVLTDAEFSEAKTKILQNLTDNRD